MSSFQPSFSPSPLGHLDWAFALSGLQVFGHIGLTCAQLQYACVLAGTALIFAWPDGNNTAIQLCRPLCHSPDLGTQIYKGHIKGEKESNFYICTSNYVSLCCTIQDSNESSSKVSFWMHVNAFNFVHVFEYFPYFVHTDKCGSGLRCTLNDMDQNHWIEKGVIWLLTPSLQTQASGSPSHKETWWNWARLNIDCYWWPIKEGRICGGNAVAAVRLHILWPHPGSLREQSLTSIGFFML